MVGQAVGRDAERLRAEPGDADGQQHPADDRVLWPGLDADAVGPPPRRAVAAQDRPRHAHHEHRARGVAHRRVGPVHVAVQELGSVGKLVVDLQGGGHPEKDQEAEVDERVHHPGARLAQQGAHIDTGPEVGHAVFGVVRGGATVVGPAPLPVLGPVGEQDRPADQQNGNDRVEGGLHRRRNVAEHLAGNGAVAVEPGDAGHDARGRGEGRQHDTGGDAQMMGLDPGPHSTRDITRRGAPKGSKAPDAPGWRCWPDSPTRTTADWRFSDVLAARWLRDGR